MGGIVSSLFGSGGNAGAKGAAAQQGFNQQGINEIRNQFDQTLQLLTPFIDAGTNALPGLTQGSTPQGLDQRLGQIFDTNAFARLKRERTLDARGQLGSVGLSRSGLALREAADIPTDLGLQIEGLLTGRLGGLAGLGQSSALGLGNFGANSAGNIANLFSQSGQAASSGAVTDAQAKAQGSQNLLNTAAAFGGAAAKAGGIGSLLGSVFAFSDPNLKENAEEIGQINNLKLYQWDWKPETRGTLVETFPTIGFMADEVMEKYPDRVTEYAGFKVIDYPGLLDELETKWQH